MTYLHFIIWSIYIAYSIFTYCSLTKALNSQYESDTEGWDLLYKGMNDLKDNEGHVFSSVEAYTSSIFKTQQVVLGGIAIILSLLVETVRYFW